MKISGIVVGMAALIAAGSANATVVYDTMTGQTPIAGFKPVVSASKGPLGNSFIASSTEWLQSVSFEVKDATTDTGSVLIYLVPDGAVTGAPTLPSSSGTTLSGATLLGTISDNGLFLAHGNNYAVVSLSPGVTVAAGTYWIEMVDGNSSANGNGNPTVTNLQWGYNLDTADTGVPTSGDISSYANTTNTGLAGPALGGTAPASGLPVVFEMQIQTPEPASLAVLGAGLMGLGFVRRRWSKKSSG